MKNTIKKGQIHVIIIREGNTYRGFCREFGFIEEGKNPEEVENRIISGAKLLLKTVSKNPNLEPSLNAGLPPKYRLKFYMLLLRAIFRSLLNSFNGDLKFTTHQLRTL